MNISGTFLFWAALLLSTFTVAQESPAPEGKIPRIIPTTYTSVLNPEEITAATSAINAQNLSSSRQWSKLLHIERNAIGIKGSQISDPSFFLSKDSRFSNQSEIIATFLSFFEDPKAFAQTIDAPTPKLKKISSQIEDHSQHSLCRFPARLAYLKKALGDFSGIWQKLPVVNCTFFSIYFEALQPKSVSFVFSSYYSDSPGSAFGHTFFKINRGQSTAGDRQELLDYGVGYAANASDTNPITYALLGLVGGFTGTWTNVPYYYKVREYSDFEARDLWSYDLDLTNEEVQMLVWHLWEVGAHYYTYFFFTQNCAYHMLTVLEAAAPRLELSEHVPFYYVIPSDSMKALFYNPGLVKDVTFRPSIRTTFLSRANRINDFNSKKFNAFAKTLDLKSLELDALSPAAQLAEAYAPTTPEQRAFLLDASIDLIDLRAPNPTSEKHAQFRKIKSDLLSLRAQTDFVSPELIFNQKDFEDPSRSHGSSRASAYFFQKSNVKSGLFEYRFALHDLLDPSYGLPKNSQLEFFNLSFELLPNDLKLKEGALFRVLNINPINFFETKPSWGVEVGVQNRPQYCAATEYACYLTGMQFKGGYAVSSLPPQIGPKGFEAMAWVMGSVNLRGSSRLSENGDLYLAPGFLLGLHLRFSDTQAVLAEFGREYPLQMDYFQNYDVQYRWTALKDLGISARIINDQYGLGLNYYY